MHAGVLPAHLVGQPGPAARPLDAHVALRRRASSRNDGLAPEAPRRVGVTLRGAAGPETTTGFRADTATCPETGALVSAACSQALIAAPAINHLPRGFAAASAPLSIAR